MRKVISEILHTGLYSELYLGNKPEKYAKKYGNRHDCAIVSIKIDGINHLDYTPKNATELFASEITRVNNILQYDNQVINVQDNISTIGVNIRIPAVAKSAAKNAA